MKFKRSVITLSAVALGLGVAGCSDDDDDDIIDDDIEESIPDPDLDPGAGSGLPGDEGDEGTTG